MYFLCSNVVVYLSPFHLILMCSDPNIDPFNITLTGVFLLNLQQYFIVARYDHTALHERVIIMCVYVQYVCIYICTYIHTYIHIHTNTHTHTHTYIHAYTHTYMHTYIHTYIYIYIYIHT